MLVFLKTSAILNLLVRKILGWRLKNGQVEETKGREGVKNFYSKLTSNRMVFLFFFTGVRAKEKKGRKEKALLGSKHFTRS